MFEILDYRAFFSECYYECAKHFPVVSDCVLEQMTNRLSESLMEEPDREITKLEMVQRCQQFSESLKGLEHDRRN